MKNNNGHGVLVISEGNLALLILVWKKRHIDDTNGF